MFLKLLQNWFVEADYPDEINTLLNSFIKTVTLK